MSNKEKLLASAQKALQKGQVARAIKDYQKLVELDPRDVRNRQKLAELYSRDHKPEEALEAYEAVAKHYAENGFYLKAIAVYKQMQKVEPTRVSIYHRLAELNEKQGLVGNALAEYRSLVAYYEKNSMLPEAINVLQKMKELEPENLNILVKIAETYATGDLKEKAREEFQEVLNLLHQKQDFSRILKLYDLFLPHFPDDPELRLGQAETLIDRGDIDKGLESLRELLKNDPDNTEILLVLALGYRKRADFENERLTYQHLLKNSPDDLEFRQGYIAACLNHGDGQRAINELEDWKETFFAAGKVQILKDYYQKLREVEPDDERVLKTLHSIYELTGEGDKLFELLSAMPAEVDGRAESAPVPGAEEILDGSILDEAVEDLEDHLDFVPESSPAEEPDSAASEEAVEEPVSDPGAGVEEEAEEIPLEFLEGVGDLVFDEPGAAKEEVAPEAVADKEISSPEAPEEMELELELEINLEPESDLFGAEAVEGASELNLSEEGAEPEPVDEMAGLELAEEDAGLELAEEDAGLELAEEDAGLELVEEDAGLELGEEDAELELGEEDAELELGEEDAGLELVEEATELELVEETTELELVEEATELELVEEATELELVEEDAGLELVEEATELELVEEDAGLELVEEDADLELVEEDAELELLEEAAELAVTAAPGKRGVSGDVALPEPASEVAEVAASSLLQGDLEEAEFYLQQGLYEDAERVLDDLSARFPDSGEVTAKRAELAAAREAAATPATENYVDLAGDLREEAENAVDDAFQFDADFGVGDSAEVDEIDQEDAESHYNLGIAYKEMGLIDDAIAEFEKAQRNRSRALDALTLKGLCLIEKGLHEEAEKTFSGGLGSLALSPSEEASLQFELGLLYQILGRPQEALGAFEAVAAQDHFYRDVGEKIAALRTELGLGGERSAAPAGTGDKKNRVSYL